MRISSWVGLPAVLLAAVLTIGCGPDTSTEVLEGPIEDEEMEAYGEAQEVYEEQAEQQRYE